MILFQKQFDGTNGKKLINLFEEFQNEFYVKGNFSMSLTKDLFGDDLLVMKKSYEGEVSISEITSGKWIVIFEDGNVVVSDEKLDKDPIDEADMVNHPPHYNQGSIETIDYILETLGKDGFVSYCWGNALKYLSRANFKGKRDEDLKKANWYLNKLCEVIE